MKLFSPLVNKAQMNAQSDFAVIPSLFHRCQVRCSYRALLSKRTSYAHRMGLIAISWKPVCYDVSVGGNSAAALFDMVM